MWHWLKSLGTPREFYYFAGWLLPYVWVVTALLFIYGLIGALYLSPPDYQQGDGVRIIYVHVPAAFLSMMIYGGMAMFAAIALIWRVKIANAAVKALAPLGAWITFLALFTGSVWGKPMWGTFWIWDARLTSELILLFVYIGYLALHNSFSNMSIADKAGNILVLVGVVNLPIIHYSVIWWNTLHQGASLSKFARPSIVPEMLYPLLAMIAAFMLFALAVGLMRLRNEILMREKNSRWINDIT
jgi:heme exporter protein C